MTTKYDSEDQKLSDKELEDKYMKFTDCAALGHPHYSRGMFANGKGPVPSQGPYWTWVQDCIRKNRGQ